MPSGNDYSIRDQDFFGTLFEGTGVPEKIEGFEEEDAEKIKETWPEGTEAAKEVSQVSLLLTAPSVICLFYLRRGVLVATAHEHSYSTDFYTPNPAKLNFTSHPL